MLKSTLFNSISFWWSLWLSTNVDSILKSRDITLSIKVHLVKAMVFPVVIYGCESWTIKKAEHQRIDAFKLWCWRRLLRVPRTARRSNQSILKETSPEYSLEGLMLKLKFQYFSHLMWRTDSFEKILTWENQEEKGTTEYKIFGWHHQLDGPELEQAPGVSDGQGSLVLHSPIAQLLKNPPAIQEILDGFLGQEDALEKG